MRFLAVSLFLVFPAHVFGGDINLMVFETKPTEVERVFSTFLVEDPRGKKVLRLNPVILGSMNFFNPDVEEDVHWPEWLSVEIKIKDKTPFLAIEVQW